MDSADWHIEKDNEKTVYRVERQAISPFLKAGLPREDWILLPKERAQRADESILKGVALLPIDNVVEESRFQPACPTRGT